VGGAAGLAAAGPGAALRGGWHPGGGAASGAHPGDLREYAKRVMETMRVATGEGDVLALCWLYGYSRALQDSDEQVMRKQRGV